MQSLDPRVIIVFFFKDKVGPLLVLAIVSVWILVLTLGAANLPILEGSLPQADSNSFVGSLTLTGLALAIMTFLSTIVLPALLILSIVWAWLQFSNYRYEIADTAFRKEYGVIQKRYVSIPYEQIQNVDVIRTLNDRIVGLSELQIQTAGMSEGGKATSPEGILPGLSKQEAESLRNELIRRASISQ